MTRTLLLGTVAAGFAALAGCQLAAVAVDNYQRDAAKTVEPQSLLLADKSFAVLVTADRSIQGDHPQLVEYLTAKITERLADPANTPRAGGFVPAADVLRYVYDNPGWAYQTREDLGRALGGVQRLVVVEVIDYQLHEPGNQYVWEGRAAGTVTVFDLESSTPELAALEKSVSVPFPDQRGQGPEQLPRNMVNSALALRFVDRATWLFYSHKEPYHPTY